MSRLRPDTDALEARLAGRLAGALSLAQATLHADTVERLRFARKTAVARARQARTQARAMAAAPTVVTVALAGAAGRGSIGLGGLPFGPPVGWWQRVAALLPLVVLVAGLVGILEWTEQEQIAVAADIDARLLADDLPPAAYVDPGFAEFLLHEPPSQTQ
ncbi:MAG: DUF3619 family protein [Rubrivivax sp.]